MPGDPIPEVTTIPHKLITASELNSTHVLIGESGGLSAVYDVYTSYSFGGLAVETEHGTIYVDADDEITVIAEETPNV